MKKNFIILQEEAVTEYKNSHINNDKRKPVKRLYLSIFMVLATIFLVIFLPILNRTTELALQQLNRKIQCSNTCDIHIVESIPEGVVFGNDSVRSYSTYETWLALINLAHTKIEIASFYWTLRQSDVYPDPSSAQGENIFQSILKAGRDKGISIKIVQNLPNHENPNTDTEYLVNQKAAEVRSLDFSKLMGEGVLHTKMWIVDRSHIYIGSANMDWRALTQVKELGVAIFNCSCLAEDVAKIFEVYWYLGQSQIIPKVWPSDLDTIYNINNPMKVSFGAESSNTFVTSSPKPFNPNGRTNDIDALLYVMNNAEDFIYVAVMDYFPLTIYTSKVSFWPVIDDAIKSAAIDRRLKIKMLISSWTHSRPSEDSFLRSLLSISDSYPHVSIEVRRFVVPANQSEQKIPFARVNHNKYMVTDKMVFIGTSNWSGDYFIDTAGVSLVTESTSNFSSFRHGIQETFERDWNSIYSHDFH